MASSTAGLAAMMGRLSLLPCHCARSSILRSMPVRPSIARIPPTVRHTLANRPLSTTAAKLSWLMPGDVRIKSKTPKGRPKTPIGGSTRGTTVVWGDWGMRMTDKGRRLSQKQLKIAEETIRRKLRGQKYRLYTRISSTIAVFTKGNETRMGKGKGGFDYWAARVPVSRIILEVKGDLHERAVRDAFRVAAAKLPGSYEVVKRGDAPVMGLVKLDGLTEADVRRPRKILEPKPDTAAPEAVV